MNIVFMGTPDFAATILEDLIEQHEVLAVYSRPDAVRNRGQIKEASPVKLMAERYGIPVYTPQTLQSETVQQHLMALAPDVICVAAYGALLPPEILKIPVYGCLNVHGSLLPKWRGAAPVERAILAGDIETGVCVMRMEEGLDTGDYCVCRTTNIEGKSASELSDELANLGSHALLTALIHLQEGALDWTAQDEASASYAEKIGKHELDLSPKDSSQQFMAKVQASSSAHPARCIVAGRPVTILGTRSMSGDDHVLELVSGQQPGSVRFVEKRLFLGTADTAVEILSLKPDGKQAMDAKAFAAGIHDIKQGMLSWDSPDAG